MGTCIALSSCGSFLAVCTSDKNLTVWKLSSMDVLKQWKAARKVSSLTFNSDSSQLLVAGNITNITVSHFFSIQIKIFLSIVYRQSWWLLFLFVRCPKWYRKTHFGTSLYATRCGITIYLHMFYLANNYISFFTFRLSHLITNLSSPVKEMKRSGFLASQMPTIFMHIV